MLVQGHVLPFHSLVACIDCSIPLKLSLWFGELKNYHLSLLPDLSAQSTNNEINLRHGHILFTTHVNDYFWKVFWYVGHVGQHFPFMVFKKHIWVVLFFCNFWVKDISMITLHCSKRRSSICWNEFQRVNIFCVSSWFGKSNIFWLLCSSAVIAIVVECLKWPTYFLQFASNMESDWVSIAGF